MVHQVDQATGSLLMDRIVPGTSLLEVHGLEDESFTIWCSLRRLIPAAPSDGLLTAEDYYPPSRRLSQLLETAPEPRFLHGDLHHENILWGDGRWWAIDPKGLWGDPAWEAAAFLRNPYQLFHHLDDLAAWTLQRIHQLALEIGCDAGRIWAWAMVDVESDEPEPGSSWTMYRSALPDLEREFSP
jgi:hypothetical protein